MPEQRRGAKVGRAISFEEARDRPTSRQELARQSLRARMGGLTGAVGEAAGAVGAAGPTISKGPQGPTTGPQARPQAQVSRPEFKGQRTEQEIPDEVYTWVVENRPDEAEKILGAMGVQRPETIEITELGKVGGPMAEWYDEPEGGERLPPGREAEAKAAWSLLSKAYTRGGDISVAEIPQRVVHEIAAGSGVDPEHLMSLSWNREDLDSPEEWALMSKWVNQRMLDDQLQTAQIQRQQTQAMQIPMGGPSAPPQSLGGQEQVLPLAPPPPPSVAAAPPPPAMPPGPPAMPPSWPPSGPAGGGGVR